MMKRAFAGALLLAAGVGTTDRLFACGDKYLSLGLGTHYERSAAERRAAAILVYADTGTELSRLLTTLSVEAAMKKAGYQPAVVVTSAALDAALRAQRWDVVVLDGRDVQAIVQRLQKPAGPHVVPVLTKPAKDELKQARKIYGSVIDSPSKNRVFVDAIEDALDLHEMEMGAAAKATRRPTR